MDAENIRSYFGRDSVVRDYAEAAEKVGLWESEKAVVQKYVAKNARILELGCGAGRVARGLCELGYENILATDFAEEMVEAARAIGQKHGDKTVFDICDATQIGYSENSFDAVLFCFNGLMQIPRAENRLAAARNVFRILKSDGVFVFTTHDRDKPEHSRYWETERKRWSHNAQQTVLDEFGDIFYRGERGNIFIHSPSKKEIAELIAAAGFALEFSAKRSDIAQEPQVVADFSDDCIFWVARKSLAK